MKRKIDNYKKYFNDSPQNVERLRKLTDSLKEQSYIFYNNNIGDYKISDLISPPNEMLIHEVVINAMIDILRIADFHPVQNPTRYKYAAYVSYWWLRMKPLYPLVHTEKDAGLTAEETIKTVPYTIMTSVNEIFVTDFIRATVGRQKEYKPCIHYKKITDNVNDFLGSFIYFLQYRDFTAKQLELVLKAVNICPIAHILDIHPDSC